MKISDALDIIKKQLLLMRTVEARPISEYGLEVLEATLSDQDNYHVDVYQCKNCKFIASSLLFEEGCKNCGGKDIEFSAIKL